MKDPRRGRVTGTRSRPPHVIADSAITAGHISFIYVYVPSIVHTNKGSYGHLGVVYLTRTPQNTGDSSGPYIPYTIRYHS